MGTLSRKLVASLLQSNWDKMMSNRCVFIMQSSMPKAPGKRYLIMLWDIHELHCQTCTGAWRKKIVSSRLALLREAKLQQQKMQQKRKCHVSITTQWVFRPANSSDTICSTRRRHQKSSFWRRGYVYFSIEKWFTFGLFCWILADFQSIIW